MKSLSRRLSQLSSEHRFYVLSDLISALIAGGSWDRLAKALTTLTFLKAKAEAGLTYELARDVGHSVDALPATQPQRQLLLLLRDAIRKDLNFLGRHPTTLFQCLWNSCFGYARSGSPRRGSSYNIPSARSDLEATRGGIRLGRLLKRWRSDMTRDSPDLRWIRAITHHDFPLGTGMMILAGHERAVRDIFFSSDGKLLASLGDDQTVRVWDAYEGRCLASFANPDTYFVAAAFLPNSQQLISLSTDKKIRTWDIASSQESSCTKGPQNKGSTVTFSHDARTLAVAARDIICVWDIARQRAISHLRLSGKYDIEALAFLDAHHVALCTWSGNLVIWNWSTKQVLWRCDIPGRSPHWQHYRLAASADGCVLAASPEQGNVTLWDLTRRRRVQSLSSNGLRLSHLALSPDGSRMLEATYDDGLRIRSCASGTYLGWASRVPGTVYCATFSPDGRRVAFGTDRNIVAIVDATAKQGILESAPEPQVVAFEFTPDGKHVICAASNGRVDLRHVETGRLSEAFVHREAVTTCIAVSPTK